MTTEKMTESTPPPHPVPKLPVMHAWDCPIHGEGGEGGRGAGTLSIVCAVLRILKLSTTVYREGFEVPIEPDEELLALADYCRALDDDALHSRFAHMHSYRKSTNRTTRGWL